MTSRNQLIEAASVLLARSPSSHSLLVVQRSSALQFFGGYRAFPGGKVDPEDSEVPLRKGETVVHHARRATAIRELFEETGLLLARREDESFPVQLFHQERQAIIEGELLFGDFLIQKQLHLDFDDLTPVGELVTPSFAPRRFDTSFFVAVAPPHQEFEIWKGELDSAGWLTAEEALQLWRQGTIRISPPSIAMLETICGHPVESLPERFRPVLQRLEDGELPVIPFAPGVDLLPLQTVALPPATITNAYLAGTDETYLIDPGAHEPTEQARLIQVLERLPERGRNLKGILLTHHHADHINAVNVCAQQFQIPIFAHEKTAKLLLEKIPDIRHLQEGDRIALGKRPDGLGDWHLEVLFVPGHASGHLAFFERHYKFLFAGDLVSMLSSVIIAPPDGDLMHYLASIQRIQQMDCRLLLPGHGSPTTRPGPILERCLQHRARREEELITALSEGPQKVESLVQVIYPELDSQLVRLAQLQTLAGLLKLEQEKRVKVLADERYQLLEL